MDAPTLRIQINKKDLAKETDDNQTVKLLKNRIQENSSKKPGAMINYKNGALWLRRNNTWL